MPIIRQASAPLRLSILSFMLAGASLLADEPTSTAPAEPAAHILLQEDFRTWSGTPQTPGVRMLETNLPTTTVQDTPPRVTQGVPRAFVRALPVEPQWEDGRLNIAVNEVGQGLHRVFADPVPFDHTTHALVMRMTTFTDAALAGTNSIAVRLWAQRGQGPNHHRERMELSTHFNAHARGARQIYPNAYHVRDGYETWAMPEGTNARRAGIYYRLGAEGRNDEIRGGGAVPKAYYWTWKGLEWPKGWASPVGGGMYEPTREADALSDRIGGHVYTTTAVYRRAQATLTDDPNRFATQVDVQGARASGRVLLQAPLPPVIEELCLLLRSELTPEGQTWFALAKHADGGVPLLGVADVHVSLVPRADATLDGVVDAADWHLLREHAGRTYALHMHGDASGDGVVGLDDVFVMARQWSAASGGADPDPTLWQASVDASGVVTVHLPAGSALHAWEIVLIDPEAEEITADTDLLPWEDAVAFRSPRRVGMANLVEPYRVGEAAVDVPLLTLPGLQAWQAQLRIQTALGVEARRLPVVAVEAE